MTSFYRQSPEARKSAFGRMEAILSDSADSLSEEVEKEFLQASSKRSGRFARFYYCLMQFILIYCGSYGYQRLIGYFYPGYL